MTNAQNADIRGAIEVIRKRALPFSPLGEHYQPLLARARAADWVLIGAATQGTLEFQRARVELTRQLLEHCGFDALAIDADWPDVYRVHRFVQGFGDDPDALASLSEFRTFPAWMWRNQTFVDFVRWLRQRNLMRPSARRTGLFGLDLCSLSNSRARVLEYLGQVDAEAQLRARQRYSCFDFVGREAADYGYAVAFGLSEDCESEVVQQLIEMRSRAAARIAHQEGLDDRDFSAIQDARVVLNAERYYRQKFSDPVGAWNAREFHMFHTLQELRANLRKSSESPKIVVWAHNSHVGDVKAVVTADEDERSLGDLVREAYPGRAVLVGMTTYQGTVTAAEAWGGAVRAAPLAAALPNSIESRFHATGLSDFVLEVVGAPAAAALDSPLLERSIGPVYLSHIERAKHYHQVRVARQFDFVIHRDVTHAVTPLSDVEPQPVYERSPTGTE